MHLVVGGVVRFYRQERAGADMQGDFVQANAALLQATEHCVGEMQAGGGRRHRAVMGGEQVLVIGAVLVVGGAAGGDIGRQRHRPAFRDGLVEHRTMEGK